MQTATSSSSPSGRTMRPKPNWSLRSDEVRQGNILWLGTYEDTMDSYHRRGEITGSPVISVKDAHSMHRGAYNHPIVIVSRSTSRPDMIYFCMMTSLNSSTKLKKKIPRYMPVAPAPAHPMSAYPVLSMEHGDIMEKRSWIDLQRVYKMDWHDAEVYWGADPTLRKRWTLDSGSMRALHDVVATKTGRQTRLNPLPTPIQQPVAPRTPQTPTLSTLCSVASRMPSTSRTAWTEPVDISIVNPDAPPSTLYQAFASEIMASRSATTRSQGAERRPLLQDPERADACDSGCSKPSFPWLLWFCLRRAWVSIAQKIGCFT